MFNTTNIVTLLKRLFSSITVLNFDLIGVKMGPRLALTMDIDIQILKIVARQPATRLK